MEYRMLAWHADLQSLEMSPVFTEYPSRIRELQHHVDDLFTDAEAAIGSVLDRREDLYSSISCRLAPVKLAAKLAESSERLSLLQFRAKCAAEGMTSGRHSMLERSMARLDAFSPLGVLKRGYSITQKTSGEIVRNPHQIKEGERVTITLADGKLEAEVTDTADIRG
jgi:exodeoxyribonuclease VII large subunit